MQQQDYSRSRATLAAGQAGVVTCHVAAKTLVLVVTCIQGLACASPEPQQHQAHIQIELRCPMLSPLLSQPFSSTFLFTVLHPCILFMFKQLPRFCTAQNMHQIFCFHPSPDNQPEKRGILQDTTPPLPDQAGNKFHHRQQSTIIHRTLIYFKP